MKKRIVRLLRRTCSSQRTGSCGSSGFWVEPSVCSIATWISGSKGLRFDAKDEFYNDAKFLFNRLFILQVTGQVANRWAGMSHPNGVGNKAVSSSWSCWMQLVSPIWLNHIPICWCSLNIKKLTGYVFVCPQYWLLLDLIIIIMITENQSVAFPFMIRLNIWMISTWFDGVLTCLCTLTRVLR